MIRFFHFFFFHFRKEFGKYRFFRNLKKLFPSCYFPETMVITGPVAHLKLGQNVRFGDYNHIHLGGQKWSDKQGYLEIGENSVIASHCVIYAAGPGGVIIGDNFDCAPGVKIFASRSYFEDGHTKHLFGKVNIGSHVVIYSNVVIGPNVFIGDHVSIAANSVVTRDLKEPGLYGGCPAKKI